MFFFLSFFVIFSHYLRTSLFGYILISCLLIRFRKFLIPEAFFLSVITLLYVFVEFIVVGQPFIFSNALFFFGYLFCLFCVARYQYTFRNFIFSRNIIFYFCFLIILEFMIFRYFPQFRPLLTNGFHDSVNLSDSTVRALGIAGNSTMTSVLVLMLWSIRLDHNLLIRGESLAVFISILLLGSGLGVIVLFLFYLYRLHHFLVKHLRFSGLLNMIFYLSSFSVFLILILSVVTALLSEFTEDSYFWKISPDYISFLIEAKSIQATTNSDLYSIFFGTQHLMATAQTSGDFGYYNIYDTVGLVGLFIVFYFPLRFIQTFKSFPLSYSVFFISFLHYPGLLTIPGQILFAFFSYMVYTEAHNRHAVSSKRNFVPAAH